MADPSKVGAGTSTAGLSSKNQRFYRRLGFALHGVASAFRSEASFRLQSLAAVFALSFIAVAGASAVWWALFILIVSAVLSAELLDTALEHIIDRLHPDIHPSIRLAKDCAAGAVLVLSFASLAVFCCFLSTLF